jgi:formamidopyrimidine-DNA glycosylase
MGVTMPECPDITIYVERLNALVAGQVLRAYRLNSPFLLRTVEPALDELPGRRLATAANQGKRIVLGFDDDVFAVIHLMIAGRLHWKKPGAALPRRNGLIAFDFESGSLTLTEAGSKRRASLHLFRGAEALEGFDRGGLEVLGIDLDTFSERLLDENHTLKRSLTDPRIFSGIGNAYSDEILHQAGLSPFKQTRKLDPAEMKALYRAIREVLTRFTETIREEVGDGFPEKVTAFRTDMAVHGKFQQPCPRCGSPVQRIVYAKNEANYCATCQTGGKMLADRALSRLLKDDWPKTIDESTM